MIAVIRRIGAAIRRAWTSYRELLKPCPDCERAGHQCFSCWEASQW